MTDKRSNRQTERQPECVTERKKEKGQIIANFIKKTSGREQNIPESIIRRIIIFICQHFFLRI